MSTRTIAVCDLCGHQRELKTSGPLGDYQYDRELRMEGWWVREFDAIRDVCPSHPHPVTPGGAA